MHDDSRGRHGLLARRRGRAGGFSLVEVLASVVVVVVVVLGHVTVVWSGHRSATASEERGLATVTLQRFVERIRADTNWSTLYLRLRPLSAESANDASLSSHAVDTTLVTHAASAYYADFVPPERLGDVTFLVQVPSMTANGVPALRESLVAPRYGLPADLNGDGRIDSSSQNYNFHVLPVVVRLRWRRGGGDPQEVVLATWIRRGV